MAMLLIGAPLFLLARPCRKLFMESFERLILNATSDFSSETLDFLKSIVALGVRFRSRIEVIGHQPNCPEVVSFPEAPKEGISLSALREEFERISFASSNFASPQFIGFPDSGNSVPAVAAGILIPLLNQNLINQDFCSPEATFVEMETIHWLRSLVGFDVPSRYTEALEIGGCSVHGGVLANTIAMLAARETLFPGTLKTGLRVDLGDTKVLAPAGINHYSIRMSLAWLGLGETNVVEVPIDDNHRISLAALENKISDLRRSRIHILACALYAGDSRTMTVDNLAAVGTLLRREGIWCHVDACHGVQLLFSHKHRNKLAGIETVDSVTLDPHKVLCIPYPCSYVLFKEPASLRNISSASDLITAQKWSLGQTTPFIGSKAFNSLKLWAVLKSFGRNALGHLVDTRIDFAQEIAEVIRQTPSLVLLNETDINSVMFMYIPKHLQTSPIDYGTLTVLNEINLEIKDRIKESGDFYVHGFPIPSSTGVNLFPANSSLQVLRIMSGNPATTLIDVRRLLSHIVDIGDKLSADKQSRLEPYASINTSPLLEDVITWVKSFTGSKEHIALVYGSSVWARRFFQSDVDLMLLVSDDLYSYDTVRKAVEHVIALHKRYGLPLDDEIPYEKKLLVPLSFARHAISGTGFTINQHQVIIPPVVKTSTFLTSQEMLARLVVNALTTQHVFLSGTYDLYSDLRQKAMRCVLWLMMKQLAHVSCSNDLCDSLYAHGGVSGEAFLGYKYSSQLDAHLRPFVRQVFLEMVKKGEIVEFDGLYVLSQKFDFNSLTQLRLSKHALQSRRSNPS